MNKEAKKLFTGALVALLVPLIGLMIFYFAKFSQTNLLYYLDTLRSRNLIAPVISLSLVPNILLFYRYINQSKYRQGQGVILALLLWGIVIVYYKFLA